jgi:hypothetical protein
MVRENNIRTISQGVQLIKDVLATGDNTVISSIYNQFIVRQLVQLFASPNGLVPTKVKFELAWIITNLTMGT